MKAMILAAGLGTRLRPLTESRPKALVEVGGRTLLEITLTRLRSFGISEVIVNAHHLADILAEYLRRNDNFGMRVEISREDVLLDTGGGLKKAAWFFEGDDEPFVLHNVDVISTIDLPRMAQFHVEKRALATLGVQRRESSRQLLFRDGQLCGRAVDGKPHPERLSALAFTGIHIVSPSIFSKLREEGVFPIMPAYLRLAAEGEKIIAFRADEYYWRDLGRVEHLEEAEQDLRAGKVSFAPGRLPNGGRQ